MENKLITIHSLMEVKYNYRLLKVTLIAQHFDSIYTNSRRSLARAFIIN